MSDYHILEQTRDGKQVNVVFHVTVPASGTNSAGVTWRDAVVKERENEKDESGNFITISSMLKNINAGEATNLANGALIEVNDIVRFSRLGLTPAQKRTEIENYFNVINSNLITEKQAVLEWIGQDGDVP